ncbi:hypothetical protein ACO0OL_002683 [Hanseniaspora opuntiae]|jgi:septin 7
MSEVESNNITTQPTDQVFEQVLPQQPEFKVLKKKLTQGYVGFANLPKQYHRKSIRQGFEFNLMLVGKDGLGKKTLINTLFNRDLTHKENELDSTSDEQISRNLSEKLRRLQLQETATEGSAQDSPNSDDNSINLKSINTVIEENGVNLRLNVVHTEGFGGYIDNSDAYVPIMKEIHRRYDYYLEQENLISRKLNEFNDPRIHCVLYLIEPNGHGLTDFDLEFCSKISPIANLIPIIAKSDTLKTNDEIEGFKKRILKQLADYNVNYFTPAVYHDDDKESSAYIDDLLNKFPLAVMAGTDLDTTGKRARIYPWGILNVDNPQHSDFTYLKDLLIKQFMEELKEKTSKVLYEEYRSQKLVSLGIKQDNSIFKEFDPSEKLKEEKSLHEAKLSKLESEMKQIFLEKVLEKEKKLQKSENELFLKHKEMKDKLMKQLKALEEKKYQLEMHLQSNNGTSAKDDNTKPSQASITTSKEKKKGFLR